MTFAEKLKALRKTAGFSQEKLAEKLGVSRQAVTKWETEAGIPDIENVKAVAALFGVSLDELLLGEKRPAKTGDYLFESVIEYDIDRPKRYDMKLGGARQISICGYDGEKLRVRLASDQLPTLQSDFKLKIDGARDRLDLDLVRLNGATEKMAKDALTIFVCLPEKYIYHVELDANAELLELTNLRCEEIELNVKASRLTIDGVTGEVEVDCGLDMQIDCRALQGSLALNQVSATSKLTLPADYSFRTLVKGLGNSVSYEKKGQPCADFSSEEAENVVELNGMKNELIIAAAEGEEE